MLKGLPVLAIGNQHQPRRLVTDGCQEAQSRGATAPYGTLTEGKAMIHQQPLNRRLLMQVNELLIPWLMMVNGAEPMVHDG